MMRILFSQSNDPYFNLATEEYLITTSKYPTPIVFLWQNENTIVVGRNQNTVAEINFQAVDADKVRVVRRNTGGGTVFQDLGNLCFSLIIDKHQTLSADEAFQLCLTPMLGLLRSLGLNANFKGRNDLEVDGMKISGNAQLQTTTKILSHGTILFDVGLTKLGKYLNVNPVKLATKKVRSVQARVTNIKPLLTKPLTISEFKQLVAEVYSQNHQAQTLSLDAEDVHAIEKLAQEKYRSWEWNYGQNETFQLNHQLYWPTVGLVQVLLSTNEGIIQNIKFYGDFLGTNGTETLSEKIIGLAYDIPTIQKALATINLKEIFGAEMNEAMIIELLFQ